MGPDAEKVYVAIGILKSEVSNLSDKIDGIQDRTTDEHRKVHDIVVATSDAMRNLVRTVDDLKRSIDEMKPLTEDYREKRAEQRGEDRYKNWLYGLAASIGGLIVLVLSKAWDVVSARPHP